MGYAAVFRMYGSSSYDSDSKEIEEEEIVVECIEDREDKRVRQGVETGEARTRITALGLTEANCNWLLIAMTFIALTDCNPLHECDRCLNDKFVLNVALTL